tara:strand:+ start:12830 stop:13498 length:669 start_codon:yes stop_codon:yes gene_type:complete
MVDYEQKTRQRYKDDSYAKNYKMEYLSSLTFKGFKSRIIAYREIYIIRFFLNKIIRNNMLVMDIPCGTGKLGKILSNYPIKIVAADVSQSMLNLAYNEYSENKTKYEIMDATKIPYKNTSFDIIVCLRLFQRLPLDTRQKILSEFNRTTKKYLIISYSFSTVWQKYRYKIKRLINKKAPKFFSEPKNTIIMELNDFGFDVLESKLVLKCFSSEIIFLAKKKG